MNKNTTQIEQALIRVRSQIHDHARRYARNTDSVSLLAVSKKKPIDDIRAAIAAGQKAFGENYVDEAVDKITNIADASLCWHFIGTIQSRKSGQIAQYFQWAHSVDRLKVARRLSQQRPSELPPLNICLQVNLDGESTKAGVSLEELAALAAECAELPGITMRGLMSIPAPRQSFEDQRQVLARLRIAYDELKVSYPSMDTLSMGMSNDMEAAIAEGSTMVRVGTAIFGSRDPQ